MLPSQNYVENYIFLKKFYFNYENRRVYFKDIHIPQLYICSPKSDLYNLDLFKNHTIILQDKFSCIPPLVLNPLPNSTIIDACASPGNKSSYLVVNSLNSSIYAVEMNESRMELMKTRLRDLCPNVHFNYILEDFTEVDPLDDRFSHVKYILVDPSCTGSGIAKRFETRSNTRSSNIINSKDAAKNSKRKRNNNYQEEQSAPLPPIHSAAKRINNLATFQRKILGHAFKFPNVQSIVYSTCSLNLQENEQIVFETYQETKADFYLANVMLQQFPTLRGYNYLRYLQDAEINNNENLGGVVGLNRSQIDDNKWEKKMKNLDRFFAKCLRSRPPLHYGQEISSSLDPKWQNYVLEEEKAATATIEIEPEKLENFVTLIENGFFVALFKRRRRLRTAT